MNFVTEQEETGRALSELLTGVRWGLGLFFLVLYFPVLTRLYTFNMCYFVIRRKPACVWFTLSI